MRRLFLTAIVVSLLVFCNIGASGAEIELLEETPDPTDTPTDMPIGIPTNPPTDAPTDSPTNAPTVSPTNVPTEDPTEMPIFIPPPMDDPTIAPTDPPTDQPTDAPTNSPTNAPTSDPTESPTESPTNDLNYVSSTFTVQNGFAFVVLTEGGAMFTLGEAPYGGLLPGDATFNTFDAPVSYIVASRFAFVAVLDDQTYIPWGVAAALTGAVPGFVSNVVANEAAFAGINATTGGVFALGSKHHGGNVLDNARCNGFAQQLSSD
eukprot:gene30453-34376_t